MTAMQRAGEIRPDPASDADWPVIAVVVVTYRAADFITECLDSLLATRYPALRIIVVDNRSPDGTADVVAAWGEAAAARHGVRFERIARGAADADPTSDAILVDAGANLGFAGGVNCGLDIGLDDAACDLFWILNPDTVVEAQTPFALARKARSMGHFAVIGGRVLYLEDPARVQADGGRLHKFAGTAISVNIGAAEKQHPMPSAESLDYIPGVSMLVSREFIEIAGPMPEHYFLYFEEIDWQLRRGTLPLAIEPSARVFHRAGASIGSASTSRGASPLSIYFTCRNLPRFVRRWSPWKLPFAYLLAYYKLVRRWGVGGGRIAAAVRGLHGMSPPDGVRAVLPEEIWRSIFSTSIQK